MNRKRMITLLALMAIMAVLILPALLPHDKHIASQWPAVTAVPPAKTDLLQLTTTGEKQPQLGTQTKGALVAEDEKQPQTSRPDQAVEPAASPVPNPSEAQGCQVGIAVVGRGGELLYTPADVKVISRNKWGITALGALDATGLAYAMKPMWPDFVDSIGGQACQGVAGWMYMVNGEIPMHLADKHPVKEGDQVIWWYSESMDQAPPVWDKLAQAQH